MLGVGQIGLRFVEECFFFLGDAVAEFLGTSGNCGCQPPLQPLGDTTSPDAGSVLPGYSSTDSSIFTSSFYQPHMSEWMIGSVVITHQTRSFKIPSLCVKLWTAQRRELNRSVTSESSKIQFRFFKYIKYISERSVLCL